MKHTLFTNNPATRCFQNTLGINLRRAGFRYTADAALAFLLHEADVPAVGEGESAGGVVYPGDHLLRLGANLFAGTLVRDQRNDREPVIVGCLPESTIENLTSSIRGQDKEAVVRVLVSGIPATVQICAWRIHELVTAMPGFNVQSPLADCSVPSDADVDLYVRRLSPLEEPAFSSRVPEGHAEMTFRVGMLLDRTVTNQR